MSRFRLFCHCFQSIFTQKSIPGGKNSLNREISLFSASFSFCRGVTITTCYYILLLLYYILFSHLIWQTNYYSRLLNICITLGKLRTIKYNNSRFSRTTLPCSRGSLTNPWYNNLNSCFLLWEAHVPTSQPRFVRRGFDIVHSYTLTSRGLD